MARVIKGGARVIPAAVVDARERAEAIVADARAEARRTREATRAELEAEARAQAHAEVAAAIVAIEEARREAVDAVHGRLVELSLAVARRVIGEALAADPAVVRAHARDALDRVRRASVVTLRVHPDDRAHVEDLGAPIEEDDSLTPGDCVVTSDLGDVDGRVQTRIARLADALREAAG